MTNVKVRKILEVFFYIVFLFFSKLSFASFSDEHIKTLKNCVIAIVSGNKSEIEESIISEELFKDKKNNKHGVNHGTGFYYSENSKLPKQIITNFHVIENVLTDSGNVVFGCQKYEETYKCFPLKLIMIDKKHDLSLLQSENIPCTENLNFTNNFSETANVSTFGNKLGLGLSFLSGIVSSKTNKINEKPEETYHFTDINATYGNSGGPIFIRNTNKIIGIFKSIYNSRGQNSGAGISLIITSENILKSLERMGNILQFEKIFDFKIEQIDGTVILIPSEQKFLQPIEMEPEEELQYIGKQPVKTKLQAIYLLYEFIESDKKEINIVLSTKRKLKSIKLKKLNLD